jgi:hypothetical protein
MVDPRRRRSDRILQHLGDIEHGGCGCEPTNSKVDVGLQWIKSLWIYHGISGISENVPFGGSKSCPVLKMFEVFLKRVVN